jgi:hypothetical protein
VNELVSLQQNDTVKNLRINLKCDCIYLKTVGLRESRMANIAFVRFFTSMCEFMALHIVEMSTGICTVTAFVASLTFEKKPITK